MNNYELKIVPYLEDLSAVSDYLDCAEFQLLTQIAPYKNNNCLLYTSPSPRDRQKSRMPSSA